jgi:myo-inositol 2-dehydrogenase/D-chiro-inositol 1-dehydrogenase
MARSPAPDPTPVRYGLVGAGLMGLEHLRNLLALPGAAVVAVADPHQPSLEAARHVIARAGATTDGAGAGDRLEEFEDHRALLDWGGCDAVVVASPNMTHARVLLDVLEQGVHVLVEKPLCTTVADCRRVVEAAKGHPGVIWVGLEYRHMPPVARLVAEVRRGTLGRVRMVAMREHRYPFLPKVGDWNRFNRNTGGTLVEKCCHFFDLMNLLTEERPLRVMASGAQDVNHLDERYGGERPDILDNALVIVDYPGGARASLDLCMFAESSTNQEELSVVGDLGKAEAFLPSATFRLGLRSAGPAGVTEEVVTDQRVRHQGFHHGASYVEHLAFLEAIRTGGRASVTLDDGLWSVAMGVAAQISIAQRRVVAMEEVLVPG